MAQNCSSRIVTDTIHATVPRIIRRNRAKIDVIKNELSTFFEKIKKNGEIGQDIAQLILSRVHQDIKALDPDFFSESNIYSIFFGNNPEHPNQSIGKPDLMVDSKQAESRKQSYSQFMDDAYKTAYEVRDAAFVSFKAHAADALFINRGRIEGIKIGIVDSQEDANRNIKIYQNQLFNDILEFLKSQGEDVSKLTLYKDSNGIDVNSGDFNEIQGKIRSYLGELFGNVELLKLLQETINDKSKTQSEKDLAKLKLNAFNAWIFLKNFDDAIKSISTTLVGIKNHNILTGESDKYIRKSKTANTNTTWREGSNIDVEKEGDDFTKLMVTTSPLYIWQSGTLEDNYLVFNDLVHIAGKLKGLAYHPDVQNIVFNDTFQRDHKDVWDSLSEDTKKLASGKSLYELIALIKLNSRNYTSAVFEIFCNPKFAENYKSTIMKQFNQDELNKLYSLYLNLFNLSSENSIYHIAEIPGKSDYYKNIVQTVNSVYKVLQIQYYDDDGKITPRSLVDASISNIKRGIEQTIDLQNSHKLIKNFDRWKQKYNISVDDAKTPKIVTLTISNLDIKVEISLNSNRIRYSKNGAPINIGSLWGRNDFKEFIDSVLYINLKDRPLFESYYRELLGSNEKSASTLLNYAVRVLANTYVDRTIISRHKYNDDKIKAIKSIYTEHPLKLNYQTDSLNLTYKPDTFALTNLAMAQACIEQVTMSSTVKDGNGNQLSQSTLSRLQEAYPTLWILQEKQDWSVTKDCVLLNTPGLLKGVFNSKEFKSGVNTTQTINMSPSEMAIIGIIHDYIGGIIDKDNNEIFGNGVIGIMPEVNSDKTTVTKLAIDTNIKVNGIQLKDYTTDQLHDLIRHDIGTIYNNIITRVKQDWGRVDTLILQAFLNQQSEDVTSGLILDDSAYILPSLADDFVNGFNPFNSAFKNSRFGLLYKYPVEFIKALVRNHNNQTYNQAKSFELSSVMSSIMLIVQNKGYAIVYGHPGLGKSFSVNSGKYSNKFIDWDVEFNERRDRWIEEHSGVLKGQPGWKEARNKYMLNVEANPDYLAFITSEWNRVKNKAIQEHKILLASPSILVKLFGDEFDYALLLDKNDFVNRSEQRGEDKNNAALWKETIDSDLKDKNIPSYTVKRNTYLENLFDSYYIPFDSIESDDKIELIDLVHYLGKKDLSINRALPALLVRFNPELAFGHGINLEEYPSETDFWNRKKSEIVKELLRFKCKIDCISDSAEIRYIKENYPNWINDSGNLIFAKISGALDTDNEIEISSREDLLRLGITDINEFIDQVSNTGLLELNPILDRFNLFDYFFTQEWMITTVGSFIAHPHKKKTSDVFILEDGHIGAQTKRNVSFTASMDPFEHGLLDTTPYEYNIAILDDITDLQGTIIGGINPIKAWDGATFVNPYIVYLENNALGGKSAGLTKKQFVHYKNEATGTGGIIKTAGFAITNNLLRNSPFLLRLNYRMTNRVWRNQHGEIADIDITKDYKGNIIAYTTSDEKNKFPTFKRDGKYYLIIRIDKTGANTYSRTLQEISETGVPTDNIFTERDLHVNSNYTLWKFFGGYNSVEFNGRKFVGSEQSIKNVVTAMNSIGEVVEGTVGSSIKSLDLLYQPLKHSDIHYAPTIGAVKQGAANVNTDEAYFDLSHFDDTVEDMHPLDFQKVKMTYSGIQLDKEHHADDEELSLMTLVINACSARGYTFEQATQLYDALYKSSQAQLSDFAEALSEYVETDNIYKLREVVLKTLVDTIGNEKTTDRNFIYRIADGILLRLREGENVEWGEVKIPISDNTIYSKVLLITATYLTNSGIKQKVPGLLAVLSPSFGIYKLYGDRKYESFTNPEIELEEMYLECLRNPIYDSSDPSRNRINDIELGRTYNIVYKDVNDASKGGSRKINTPSDYKKLKKEIADGKIEKIIENVKVGRDLAAYNVRFRNNLGESFQLWDLDSYNDIVEINQVIDSIKKLPLEKQINITRNFFSDYLKTDFPQIFESNPVGALKGMLKQAHRNLLRDLMNLSESTPDLMNDYEQMVQNILLTGDYDTYACWVNLQLQSGDGDQLFINGLLTKVDSSNFLLIELHYRNVMSQLTMIKMDGTYHTIDKSSIKVQPYELILPKTFKTNFGLDEDSDLNEIVNDPDYFIRKYIENQKILTEARNYTIALRRGNGNHYLLLDLKFITRANKLTKLDTIRTEVIDGKLYRLDSSDEVMYEMLPEDEIWVTKEGQEIIVTKNVDFYIDNLSYDSVKLSNTLRLNFDYVQEGINKWKKINNPTLKHWISYVTSDSGIFNNQTLDINAEEVTKDNYKLLPESHPLIKACRAKHASFLKALETVAARIPAQGMQSFMAMKIVAFDNPDINNAYVSTMQFLLLGSDLDIDAVSIVTYDIDENGKLQLWSPYANLLSLNLLELSMKLPIPSNNSVNRIESEKSNAIIGFMDHFKQLFTINQIISYKGDEVSSDKEHIELKLNTNSIENLNLLASLLKGKAILIPQKGVVPVIKRFIEETYNLGFELTDEQTLDIFNKITDVIDNHNLYFKNTKKRKLTRIINNLILYQMSLISKDPVNLPLAHSSVDVITEPLKDISNNPEKLREAIHRGSNTFVNKYAQLSENLTGKTGISISATGMKVKEVADQYDNEALNSGDAAMLARILLGKAGKGIKINGNVYRTIANIRAKNPSTITNKDVLKALASTTNDNDAILVLSAVLSLATDFRIILIKII